MKIPTDILAALAVGKEPVYSLLPAYDDDDITKVGAQPVQLLLKEAFSLLEKDDITKSRRCGQIALDVCWEKLNSGYWRDVPPVWRTLYSYAGLVKCLCHVACREWKESMTWVDMSLLMGAPLPQNSLTQLASVIASRLQSSYDEKLIPAELEDLGPPAKRQAITPGASLSSVEDFSEFGRTGQSIPRVSCPGLFDFERDFMKAQQPVIITGAIDHWPARSSRSWSLDYLLKVAGSRTVPVELGARYTDDTWSQELMPFSEFVFCHVLRQHAEAEETKGTEPKKLGYLAQHQLFEQIPELRHDICTPDYCCLGDDDTSDPVINAWFGPKGTVSPLHHDPYHNLFAQVVGSKYIRIYSSDHSRDVYPHTSEMMNNTSQVDVDNPDLEAFPRFSAAPYWHCVVRPGDLLYIPPKYWHYVRSLSVSFSVSFWWT